MKKFSGECLTDGGLINHLSLEEPIGSMPTAKVHVFCTGPEALDSVSAPKIWEQKRAAVMRLAKTETTWQSSDIEWHVFWLHVCANTA